MVWNKPFIVDVPTVTTGIRLRASALATRGVKEAETRLRGLCASFPLYSQRLAA